MNTEQRKLYNKMLEAEEAVRQQIKQRNDAMTAYRHSVKLLEKAKAEFIKVATEK